MAKQLHTTHENVAELWRLVGDKSLTAFDIIKDNGTLLEMVDESAKQEHVKEALNTQQSLLTIELLAKFEKLKGEKKQWEDWCTEAQAKVGELQTTNVKLSKLLCKAKKKAKAVEKQLKI